MTPATCWCTAPGACACQRHSGVDLLCIHGRQQRPGQACLASASAHSQADLHRHHETLRLAVDEQLWCPGGDEEYDATDLQEQQRRQR